MNSRKIVAIVAAIAAVFVLFTFMPMSADAVFAESDGAVTLCIGVYDQTNAECGQGGTYTFNDEDMTHTIYKHVVTKGSTVQLVAAASNGYEFVGWCEGAILEGDDLKIEPAGEIGIIEPDETFVAETDKILCATFKKIEEETAADDSSESEVNDICKATNPLELKGKTATVKYSKLKKKSQSLPVSKVIKFVNPGKGAKTYTLSSALKGKKSFKKYFKINKTTGRVKVKKGLRKGTYKVKVKVQAAGDNNYEASVQNTVTFKIKVK